MRWMVGNCRGVTRTMVPRSWFLNSPSLYIRTIAAAAISTGFMRLKARSMARSAE